MLNPIQITSMLDLQGQMNNKVNPNWIKAQYPFLRAVVVEATEAIEHHGWKWWKAQQKDLPQLQMELIDIWHFMLSFLLIEYNGNIEAAKQEIFNQYEEDNRSILFDGKEFIIESLDTVSKLELLIGLSVVRRINIPLFGALLSDCEMDWDELYRQYVGKNVLNFFRQNNGYKEGTYLKTWAGREDNEHLVEVLAELDSTSNHFRDTLYIKLEERYKTQ